MKISLINKKNVLRFISINFFFSLLLLSSLSAEVPALWFTKSLYVKVGDRINIDLYVDPGEGHPIVTVSNNLNYDSKKLNFIDAIFPRGWIVLSEYPHEYTDEENGFVIRTAGFPNGTDKNTKFITYQFIAEAPGTAELIIDKGTVLDQDNNDLGFQMKKMQIFISPNNIEKNIIKIEKDSDKIESTPVVVEQKTSTISLNLYGDTAVREGQDYHFFVFTNPNMTSSGNIDLSVVDQNGREVYSFQQNFAETSVNGLGFVIPGEILTVGNYLIRTTTTYDNGLVTSIKEKSIGVLASDKDWIDNNRTKIFIYFALLVLLASIYHVHRDHEFFRRIRNKNKSDIRISSI